MLLELRLKNGGDVMFAACEVNDCVALVAGIVNDDTDEELDDRWLGVCDVDVKDNVDANAEEFLNNGVSVAVGPCVSPVPVPVFNEAVVNANALARKSMRSILRNLDILSNRFHQ